MSKHLIGHQRTRIVASRWFQHDYEWLVQQARRAGAKTLSAYIRDYILAARVKFEMRSFEEQRELRNVLIRIAMVLETYPPNQLLNETLSETKGAIGRIMQP